MNEIQIELDKILGNFIAKYKEFSNKFFEQYPNYHTNLKDYYFMQNIFNSMTIDTIKFLVYILERYNVKIDVCIFCLHSFYSRTKNICNIPENERTKELVEHFNNFGKYIIQEANADKWKNFGKTIVKSTIVKSTNLPFQLYNKRKLKNI